MGNRDSLIRESLIRDSLNREWLIGEWGIVNSGFGNRDSKTENGKRKMASLAPLPWGEAGEWDEVFLFPLLWGFGIR